MRVGEGIHTISSQTKVLSLLNLVTKFLHIFNHLFHRTPLRRNVILHYSCLRRHRGLMVERRTPEREVGGSILNRVAVLYP